MNYLRELPRESQEQLINQFLPAGYHYTNLKYDWLFNARAPQYLPAGNWRQWLILAGRGFGKTRTGSETVRHWIKKYKYVNIIGATADDARDVMIEGESGIMACCPPHERPTYKAHKRLLEWPNGAKTLVFSADQPDRLRGKQHMKLLCLIGSTSVLMADGSQKALSKVKNGDYVLTRRGSRCVTGSGLTGRQAELYQLKTSGGRVIIGTADHPIWVDGKGFTPLSKLRIGDKLCVTNALSGEAKHGIFTSAAIMSRWSGCIGRYGKRQTGQFQKGFTFTISTVLKRIIDSRIWNYFPIRNIAENTPLGCVSLKSGKRLWRLRWRLGEVIQESGRNESLYALYAAVNTQAVPTIQASFAQTNAIPSLTVRHLKARQEIVYSALKNIQPQSVYKNIAQKNVIPDLLNKDGKRKGQKYCQYNALNVAQSSSANDLMPNFANANVHWHTTQRVESVEKLKYTEDVYDIAVDGEHEFFANGILVHNCDELAAWRYPESYTQAMLGLRLGDNPQVVITTTPRPIKIIKELLQDPLTHVTRGSTYDNRDNLAPQFIEQIIKKYEGSRLGRQELYAEILDDNPNALWHRDKIDKTRVRVEPENLRRIVVGVDPSVTDSESACETGIIVAGVDDKEHAYILEDCSMRGKADQWAARAVRAYHEWGASRIIGEANNGGDLIEAVIRTVDKTVAYRKVHASRGKTKRAEPIAAIYEQDRAHHVGCFAKLEDQLCSWNPSLPDSEQESPDRMDALVWALSELMLKPTKEFLVI